MDQIPSISRSGGLDSGGDVLANPTVQTELLDHILSKLDQYWNKFPDEQIFLTLKMRTSTQKAEEENILIQLRKLREGIISTSRTDDFAAQVYRLSFFLSIIFNSSLQASPPAGVLFPNFYLNLNAIKKLMSTGVAKNVQRWNVALVLLLQSLIVAYPSQAAFQSQIKQVEETCSLPSTTYRWVIDLASCVSSNNYTRLCVITNADLANKHANSDENDEMLGTRNLSFMAFMVSLHILRYKAQAGAWSSIRVAYRELSLTSEGWLKRSLLLDDEKEVHNWLTRREQAGEIKSKEGAPGRWLICRPTKG